MTTAQESASTPKITLYHNASMNLLWSYLNEEKTLRVVYFEFHPSVSWWHRLRCAWRFFQHGKTGLALTNFQWNQWIHADKVNS